MTPTPIPCARCGWNFMRHDLDPETPRFCNNCMLKEKKHIPNEEPMKKVSIMIECDRDTHIEIEEICINEGISLSEYFTRLHKLNTQKRWKCEDSTISEDQEKPKKKSKGDK